MIIFPNTKETSAKIQGKAFLVTLKKGNINKRYNTGGEFRAFLGIFNFPQQKIISSTAILNACSSLR